MKKVDTFIKYFFLLLISLPLLDKLIQVFPENINNEKRDLKHDTSNGFSFNNFKNMIEDYDNNFNGRSMLVNLYIDLKKTIPNNSPLPQKVAIGKKGYYYLIDFNCMDEYRNVSRWKENQLEKLVTKLEDNKRILDSLNIPYVIVIVPDKQKVYPEFLPENISKVDNESRLDQFKYYLKKNKINLNVIDFSFLMITNKKKNIYFKKDSHWNYIGSFMAYKYLMNYLNTNFNISYDSSRKYNLVKEYENDLDLAKVMGESFYSKEPTLKVYPIEDFNITNFDPGFTISEYIKSRKPNFVIGKYNPDGQNKLLMFRDSYTAVWADYFTHEFQKSVFIWKYDFDRKMVIKYKPDIVIHQVAERHLDLLNKE